MELYALNERGVVVGFVDTGKLVFLTDCIRLMELYALNERRAVVG